MKKSWVIFFVSLSVVLLGGAVWLLRSQPAQVSDLEITKVVPLDAVLLCYFERVDILNETVNNPSSGWSRFVPQEKSFLRLLQTMQSEASNSVQAAELLRSKAIRSLHPQGKNGLASLVAVTLPPAYSTEQWENLLKTSSKLGNRQDYHGVSIHALGAGDSTLFTVVTNNMAFFSASQLLIQNAIRHINSADSFNDDDAFKQVMQTTGAYSDVRLFVKHRALDAFTAAVGSDKWKRYSQVLPYLADWTALDGQVSPNLIHLNGFVFPSFSDDNYLSLLLLQQGANTAWSVLPAETALAFNIGLSDVSAFLEGYKNFLGKQKLVTEYTKAQAALNERVQTNTADLFASLYVEEIAAAYIAGTHGGWVSMFKTANLKYALEQLERVAGLQKMPFTADRENQIYRNSVPGLLETLFGEPFAGIGDTYFLVSHNWIIFGNRKELLQSLQQVHTSLKKYLQSTQASQYISNNSVFSAYINPVTTAGNTELLSYLNNSFRADFRQALQSDAFKIACLQMRPSGDKLYTTLMAIYDNEEKPIAQTIEMPPQAVTVVSETQPQLTVSTSGNELHRFAVINHNNKSTEYLVQYDDYSIALLDKSGAKQWTLRIDSPIVDTLYQIDFYKNGKLQMLFTTADKMYLVDRKSQPVAPFPLSLKPAAKRLAVFDYNKDYDYRLFVLQDNTVNVYDKKGRVVDGWQPFTPKSAITRTPEFFRLGGRDFIVVCDEKTTYLLDRKGNERLTLSEPVAVQPGTAIAAQQVPPALKVTTIAGKIVTINLKDGKVN